MTTPEDIRNDFIDYFRIVSVPSEKAARESGLYDLGCEVNSGLLLSLWFDEFWDFSSPPPFYLQVFAPDELESLQSYHDLLKKKEISQDLAFDDIANDPLWKTVMKKAAEMAVILEAEIEPQD